MYNPTLGAWMTADPIGYDDGGNRYQYEHGNPISGLDPTGLSDLNDRTSYFREFQDEVSRDPTKLVLSWKYNVLTVTLRSMFWDSWRMSSAGVTEAYGEARRGLEERASETDNQFEQLVLKGTLISTYPMQATSLGSLKISEIGQTGGIGKVVGAEKVLMALKEEIGLAVAALTTASVYSYAQDLTTPEGRKSITMDRTFDVILLGAGLYQTGKIALNPEGIQFVPNKAPTRSPAGWIPGDSVLDRNAIINGEVTGSMWYSKFKCRGEDVTWTWPKHNGSVIGTEKPFELDFNKIYERLNIGGRDGTYATDYGTPYNMRSMHPDMVDGDIIIFKLNKDKITVIKSLTAPAFDQPGYGIQYKFPKNIGDLVKDDVLLIVKRSSKLNTDQLKDVINNKMSQP